MTVLCNVHMKCMTRHPRSQPFESGPSAGRAFNCAETWYMVPAMSQQEDWSVLRDISAAIGQGFRSFLPGKSLLLREQRCRPKLRPQLRILPAKLGDFECSLAVLAGGARRRCRCDGRCRCLRCRPRCWHRCRLLFFLLQRRRRRRLLLCTALGLRALLFAQVLTNILGRAAMHLISLLLPEFINKLLAQLCHPLVPMFAAELAVRQIVRLETRAREYFVVRIAVARL